MAEAPPATAGLSRTDFHGAIRANERNTAWLTVIMILIGAVLGYVIGWAAETIYIAEAAPLVEDTPLTVFQALTRVSDWGITGMIIMVIASAVWVFIALGFGDRIVLAMAGADLVSQADEPVLHNVVEEISLAAGLPKPRVAVMETPALNAFATGLSPEKAAIAVTRGMLDELDRDELQGVVAHEMSHIANNDVLYATAVGVIIGLIALVSDTALRSLRYGRIRGGGRRSGGKSKGGGAVAVVAIVILLVTLVVAPLAAKLVQMAISRQREYLADATAVKFTRDPRGLIGALKKIDNTEKRYKGANRAIQHLFIANPLRKFGAKAGPLFSTHPPTPERIDRLRNLGG